MNTIVEIKSAKSLTQAEQQEVDALMKRAFTGEEDDLVWSEVDWYIWLREDGVMVSILEIITRTVTVDEQPLLVGGIGGVGTDPAWRGRGLASQCMCSAIDFIHSTIEADYGLLICDQHLVSFYSVLGWEVINDPVYFDQPSGKWKNNALTLVYALTRRPWPKGKVDMNGLPW